jgi:hypothetical protein
MKSSGKFFPSKCKESSRRSVIRGKPESRKAEQCERCITRAEPTFISTLPNLSFSLTEESTWIGSRDHYLISEHFNPDMDGFCLTRPALLEVCSDALPQRPFSPFPRISMGRCRAKVEPNSSQTRAFFQTRPDLFAD